jgi:hypothetical protein
MCKHFRLTTRLIFGGPYAVASSIELLLLSLNLTHVHGIRGLSQGRAAAAPYDTSDCHR